MGCPVTRAQADLQRHSDQCPPTTKTGLGGGWVMSASGPCLYCTLMRFSLCAARIRRHASTAMRYIHVGVVISFTTVLLQTGALGNRMVYDGGPGIVLRPWDGFKRWTLCKRLWKPSSSQDLRVVRIFPMNCLYSCGRRSLINPCPLTAFVVQRLH